MDFSIFGVLYWHNHPVFSRDIVTHFVSPRRLFTWNVSSYVRMTQYMNYESERARSGRRRVLVKTSDTFNFSSLSRTEFIVDIDVVMSLFFFNRDDVTTYRLYFICFCQNYIRIQFKYSNDYSWSQSWSFLNIFIFDHYGIASIKRRVDFIKTVHVIHKKLRI